VFCGGLRALSNRDGLMLYLRAVQVRLKDFTAPALKLTQQLRDTSLSLARQSADGPCKSSTVPNQKVPTRTEAIRDRSRSKP